MEFGEILAVRAPGDRLIEPVRVFLFLESLPGSFKMSISIFLTSFDALKRLFEATLSSQLNYFGLIQRFST